MLSKIKIKTNWYVSRLLAEIYIRKVKVLLRSTNKSTKHQLPNKLVISLTSYKPRFSTLYPTILSLLQQKIAANEVLLWVSETDYELLPSEILKLQGIVNTEGTIFRICTTDDIGPYKKIIPTLENYNDCFIVTADDDVYYPRWWLSNLLSEYEGNNNEVICYIAHEITYENTDREVKRYDHWESCKKNNVDRWLGFPVGAGGVLYPPNCLDKRVTCRDIFLNESPMTDDIWLFWMARLNCSTTKKTRKDFKVICWPSSQKVGLINQNVKNNKNDENIKKMVNKFGWPIGDYPSNV
ncbi:hypothetical protein [Paraglaciecola chathamensis]|uniref:Glycosyl transferase n=1 Tax=Paraglaciecola chathamensis TaxID=368405 RepID=A0A8H9M0L4_9ALTE|nr:hypothetical protein [Paraglaciecola oceanifecundans]GGZ65649.1 glycosyl transferase [Paraglaciecola oceanifecundans]